MKKPLSSVMGKGSPSPWFPPVATARSLFVLDQYPDSLALEPRDSSILRAGSVVIEEPRNGYSPLLVNCPGAPVFGRGMNPWIFSAMGSMAVIGTLLPT